MRRVTRTALAVALACLVAAVAASAQTAQDPPRIDLAGGIGDEGGAIPFTVTLSRVSDVPVSVDFVSGDRTADRGRDYHARRGTVTIPAGQLSATIEFDAIQDRWLEPEERFEVTLSNPVNGRFGNSVDQSTIRNVLLAGRCTNFLEGGGRLDILTGSDGGDRINGRSDQDVIFGLGGDDCLHGHSGADQIRGGDGDDKLNGGSGNDRLNAGAGDDHLIGGRGRDRYAAGPGDDVVESRNGIREKIDCGSGQDRAIVDRRDRVRGCETVFLTKG